MDGQNVDREHDDNRRKVYAENYSCSSFSSGNRKRWMAGVAEEDRVNHGRTIKELTGQSMSSLLRIADDRGRWAAFTAEAFVGVPLMMRRRRGS